MRPAATSFLTLLKHWGLVLLPTSRETAAQSRLCRPTACMSLMSLRSSVLLHDTRLPPGFCMRPAPTFAVTSLTRCSLALLPTLGGKETEGKVVPAVVSPTLKSGGAADVESSSLISSDAADVDTRMSPGFCMRPAATSVLTLSLHWLLVLLPTSRETEAQSAVPVNRCLELDQLGLAP